MKFGRDDGDDNNELNVGNNKPCTQYDVRILEEAIEELRILVYLRAHHFLKK